MALTQEEIDYFNAGIDALCKKDTTRAKARTLIDRNKSPKEVLDKLNIYLQKDFVPSSSALGIKAPDSILTISNSEIAKIQVTVGMVPNQYSNTSSVMNDIDSLKTNTTCLRTDYNSLRDELTIVNINQTSLATRVDNIQNLLAEEFDYNFDNKFIVETKNITLIGCIRKQNTFILGDVITQSYDSMLGILKIVFDCSSWANKKIDHFFTSDGTVGGCSDYIQDCNAFTRCIEAVGVNISLV